MSETARALFYTGPMLAELRPVPLQALAPGEALVRMAFSAVSRGTERLVASGGVPAEEAHRMQCPLQEGDFPFPVKYGYCAVGVVEQGPAAWVGRRVFVLHPHQDRFICGVNWLNDVPEHIPTARATLAANMETALNAVWDSGVSAADRVVIIGGGLVGLLVTFLCAQMPGTEVTLVDTNPARAALARAFGAAFASPEATVCGADVVFHTSASAAGLATALNAARDEGTVVEMSWYGAKEVAVPLGGAFHAGRIKLISSQVGRVSPGHAARGWTYGDRLQAALRLLDDSRLDLLLGEPISFEDLPAAIPQLLAPDAPGVVSLVQYGA